MVLRGDRFYARKLELCQREAAASDRRVLPPAAPSIGIASLLRRLTERSPYVLSEAPPNTPEISRPATQVTSPTSDPPAKKMPGSPQKIPALHTRRDAYRFPKKSPAYRVHTRDSPTGTPRLKKFHSRATMGNRSFIRAPTGACPEILPGTETNSPATFGLHPVSIALATNRANASRTASRHLQTYKSE